MRDSETRICLQLPKDLLDQLKKLAKENNISLTAYLRLILTQYINKLEK